MSAVRCGTICCVALRCGIFTQRLSSTQKACVASRRYLLLENGNRSLSSSVSASTRVKNNLVDSALDYISYSMLFIYCKCNKYFP